MQVTTYDISGKKTGTVDLPDEIFGAEVKETLLWEAIKAQRARARQGTASTKRRGEVSGTGAKPFKQKGGGRARQGSLRAPHMVGGGVVMGPKPRDYGYEIPKSARKSALRSALSARAKAEGLAVLEDINLDAPKTKAVKGLLKELGARRALIVDQDNLNLSLSARNIPGSKCIAAEAINVKDVVEHDWVLISKKAVDTVVAKATKKAKGAEA